MCSREAYFAHFLIKWHPFDLTFQGALCRWRVAPETQFISIKHPITHKTNNWSNSATIFLNEGPYCVYICENCASFSHFSLLILLLTQHEPHLNLLRFHSFISELLFIIIQCKIGKILFLLIWWHGMKRRRTFNRSRCR